MKIGFKLNNISRLCGIFIVSAIFFTHGTGCVAVKFPATQAENLSGYSYIPIDPFPVIVDNKSENILRNTKDADILKLFPDNAIRISVREKTASGDISFASSSVGVSGSTYQVVVDYINADTVGMNIVVLKSVSIYRDKGMIEIFGQGTDTVFVPASGHYDHQQVPGSEKFYVFYPEDYEYFMKAKAELEIAERVLYSDISSHEDIEQAGRIVSELSAQLPSVIVENSSLYSQTYTIPIYVGVGLRVISDIDIRDGKVNITGLGAIGAAAEAKQLSGTLAVQTLGINGESVAAALPIQSELNRTTAQAAIGAVGSIKTLLYDEDVAKRARVVGLYLPFQANEELVNQIISIIAMHPPSWNPLMGYGKSVPNSSP